MKLVIATPARVLLSEKDVGQVRAVDESGSFAVRPGHADFVTALAVGVLRWTSSTGRERYAAVRGGVLRVRRGRSVHVATPEAVLGDDLAELERSILSEMRRREAAELEASRAEARFEVGALRLLYQVLGPESAELPGGEV